MGRHADDSPPSSPARKRQRLSSPTYDDQLGDFSQDDLAACDEIEYKLSQVQPHSPNLKLVETNDNHVSPKKDHTFQENEQITDDPENPFAVSTGRDGLSQSAAPMPFLGFASASVLPIVAHQNRSSPPPDEEPEEQDFSSWFAPASEAISSGENTTFFSAASTSFTGFQTAAPKGGVLVPSAAALAKAQNKMRDWEKEDTSLALDADEVPLDDHVFAAPQPLQVAPQSTPQRTPLRRVDNIPSTPSPLTGFRSPKVSTAMKGTKPFVTPFRKAGPSATPSISSRLNPKNVSMSNPPHLPTATPFLTPAPAQSQRVWVSTGFSTPLKTSMTLQKTIQKRSTPAFKTPFKPGMKPGESGRLALPATIHKPPSNLATPSSSNSVNGPKQIPPKTQNQDQVFDLTTHPDRVSLRDCGLRPCMYTRGELETKGINFGELSQITPATAKYYSFHSPNALAHSQAGSVPSMGTKEAYEELLAKGCNLAKQDWVDNHWAHILWKLAAMVALDPDREQTTGQRWTYQEVIRQLLYRYEWEINQGKRPALRLITTQDAPASYPMVLCVSNIFWSEGGATEDNILDQRHPTLEVSDGWYSLRAVVDEPMARAARRGQIKLGQKLIVAGARILSDKKDPAEPLEAYDSMTLSLSGNSAHLAPWHTKLGFAPGPWISTMSSLTADGGLVAVMDIVVVRAHNLGFIEFYCDEEGNKRPKSPINEVEEAQAQQAWERRRESETTKLYDEYEKKWYRYEGYMDRLERKAHAKGFRPSEDYTPTYAIESLYDDLEDPMKAAQICSTLDATQSGFLAQHIKRQLTIEKNRAAEQIHDEVDALCPPREVRSFRVLIVEDARTCKKPAILKAQLTVADVLKLSLSEESDMGEFKSGQRFLVTNLLPSHPGSWMSPTAEKPEIYLKTTRSTRWTTLNA